MKCNFLTIVSFMVSERGSLLVHQNVLFWGDYERAWFVACASKCATLSTLRKNAPVKTLTTHWFSNQKGSKEKPSYEKQIDYLMESSKKINKLFHIYEELNTQTFKKDLLTCLHHFIKIVSIMTTTVMTPRTYSIAPLSATNYLNSSIKNASDPLWTLECCKRLGSCPYWH